MKFTHIANPVRVTAHVIRDVIMDEGGNYNLTLDNGREYQAGQTMTSRHVPQTGDYLVRQEDGYEYLNPKDVFERKYRVIGSQMDSDKSSTMTAASANSNEERLRHHALHMALQLPGCGPDGTIQAAEKFLTFLKGAA